MIICCISAATSLLFLGPLEYSASTGFGVYRVHAFWLGVNGVQALGFTDGFVGFWVSWGGGLAFSLWVSGCRGAWRCSYC